MGTTFYTHFTSNNTSAQLVATAIVSSGGAHDGKPYLTPYAASDRALIKHGLLR